MSFKQAAADLVHEALDGEMDFLILRGMDDFAREDGDIDVLVPRGRSGHALLRVTERALEAGWTVAGVGDIGYLTQICLVQRWGENRAHRAVKVDLFDGATWAASGSDPLGHALFDGLHKTLSEAEAIGLATFLQKMLYAGYLRDRDRDRIAAACASERIMAFIDATRLPMSRVEVDQGHVSRWSRWRLRAASAGIGLARGMPGWGLRVVWRKLYFTLVRSCIPGRILLVTGADGLRRAAVIEQLRSLLERVGFPSPLVMADTKIGPVSKAWRRFRCETVVLNAASDELAPTHAGGRASVLKVAIQHHDGNGSDDLERVLSALSQHILESLRRTFPS